MTKKEIKKNLKQALQSPPAAINRKHFADTCTLAGAEFCKTRKRGRISFPAFLTMQIRFSGWKIWGAQACFLLLISGIMLRLFGQSCLETPLYAARLLFCLSVLVVMTALHFLYRSVRYRMQEVEAAARFSSVKLLTARLIIIGMGDLFLLGGIFYIALRRTSLRADNILFCLCFPFLLAGGVCLFLLGHFAPKQFYAGSMGFCTLLLLTAIVVFRRSTLLFFHAFSAEWAAVCLCLTVFCIWQFYYILYRSAYTERQLI